MTDLQGNDKITTIKLENQNNKICLITKKILDCANDPITLLCNTLKKYIHMQEERRTQ